MKKIFLSFLMIAALGSLSVAQKTINDPNAEKRNVNSFHAIDVSGGIDLYLSQGDESVAVSASETKFRDRIKTEVKNGVLKIWYESNSNINIEWGNRKLKAYVSFKNLDNLDASGGSDVSVEGTMKVNSLAMDLSGGSDFDGKVDMNDLKIDASGGSDVKISGTVKKLNVDASGGSDFKGYDLTADVCDVEASGGSDIYITVNGSVREMKSSGSSSIKKTSR